MISTSPMAPPGNLRVSLSTNAANVGIERLPFEVREILHDQSAVSVARGTLGKTVELAPGNYVVTALSPDGEILTTPSAVNVQSDRTTEARLEQPVPHGISLDSSRATPPLPDASSVLAERVGEQISKQSPSWSRVLVEAFSYYAARLIHGQASQAIDREWLQQVITSQIEQRSSFDSLGQMIQSVVTPSGPKAFAAKISWDALSGEASPDRASPESRKPISAPIYRLGPITVLVLREEARCVSVEGDEGHHLVSAAPFEEGSYTLVACSRGGDALDSEPSLIQFFFADSEANALARYLSRGDLPEAASMSTAILAAYGPTNGRGEKTPGKLATLFACYALLRQNQLEPLRDFVDRLAQLWPQSPDAAAIRAETYARMGRHTEAAELCCRVPALGVPTIASGIAYMQQRIRQYIEAAGASEDEKQLEIPTRSEFTTELKSAFKIVARVSTRLDSRSLVTAAHVLGPYRD